MALFEIIRCENLPTIDWLVAKHPVTEFSDKSRIVVSPAQLAIIVHNGNVERILEEGSWKIDSELLPFLRTLQKIPYSGGNPYSIEIYFFNKRIKLDFLWGTSDPILIIDPKYHIQLHVRARGQMGIQLKNFQYFFTTLLGSLMDGDVVSFSILSDFFRGAINQQIKLILSTYIISNKVSLFEINAHLNVLQKMMKDAISEETAKYGISVESFSIESIGVPNEDTEKLNETFNERAKYLELGDNQYRIIRGYNVAQDSANNNSAAGLILGTGIDVASLNGKLIPSQNTSDDKKEVCPKCGMELASSFNYCPMCGQLITLECKTCHTKCKSGTKYCPNCGTKL